MTSEPQHFEGLTNRAFYCIDANLTGFRLANPQAAQSELLSAIAHATARIDKALQKLNGLFTLNGKAN